MKLTVISFFRNSAKGQAQHFLKQVRALHDVWPGPVRVIAVHGDCRDNTEEVLQHTSWELGLYTELVECNHGGPVFGSVESVARFTALTKIMHAGLGALTEHDEFVWYVESDLLWDPQTVMSLADQLLPKEGSEERPPDAIAPMIYTREGMFYDIWGFRGLDGERFSSFPPFHRRLREKELTQVSSVGSAFVMTADMGMACRARENGALVDFHADAARQGFRVFVDPTQKVVHP